MVPPLLLIKKGVVEFIGAGLNMEVNAPTIIWFWLFGFTAMLGSEFCCSSPLCEEGMTSTRRLIVVTGPASAMPARQSQLIIVIVQSNRVRVRMSALLDEVIFVIIVARPRVRQVSCQSSEIRKIKQLGGIEKSVPEEVQKFPTLR